MTAPLRPPGTILQHRYLRERLALRAPGRFIEVGVGGGLLARELLAMGWRGTGWDLSAEAVERALAVNAPAVRDGRFAVVQGDWVRAPREDPVDLVISSMVLEHLDDGDEARYLARARETLSPTGRAVLLVPGSPRHWGIEDEVAGHLRRYTRGELRARLAAAGLAVEHLVGLTFPLSNALLPISNALVARAEGDRLALDACARTRHSGTRSVPFKTHFPAALGLILNDRALYPLHLVQKTARHSAAALVLYAEAVVTPGP